MVQDLGHCPIIGDRGYRNDSNRRADSFTFKSPPPVVKDETCCVKDIITVRLSSIPCRVAAISLIYHTDLCTSWTVMRKSRSVIQRPAKRSLTSLQQYIYLESCSHMLAREWPVGNIPLHASAEVRTIRKYETPRLLA